MNWIRRAFAWFNQYAEAAIEPQRCDQCGHRLNLGHDPTCPRA